MSRFIPILLISAIFFACNTEPKDQEEEKATSTNMIEAKPMEDQPTAIAVAQKESDMEIKEEIEDVPMEEKINAKPIAEATIKQAKEEMGFKTEKQVEEKKPLKTEMLKKEEVKNAPLETAEEMDKKEATPAENKDQVVEKEMVKPESKEETPKKAIPTHENWDQLVRKYISSSGRVNYKGFKADKAKLEAYLQELANNPPVSDWKRNEAMAYWINAYNANTIKLIVDNYPVKSIMDLHGGKAFDRKWIKIGDKIYSLNNIENDILRPRYKDARIHFAVNCAAKSCPPIHNRAWTASNLNSTLQAKAKAFVNNTQYNAIDKGSVEISKIFEWYASDFGNIVTYLNKYAATEIKDNAKVSYKEYDWALNE